jgi:hypothetical protein
MADFHVLKSSRAGDALEVAFHVPISGNNDASKPFAECIVEDRVPESECPWLSQAELDEITAGTVYEHIENVPMSGKITNAQRVAIVEAKAAELIPEIQARLSSRYRFWGYEGSAS